MDLEQNVRSRVHESDANTLRIQYDVKKFATAGRYIPLQKSWSETWCTLPHNFELVAEQLYNFQLRNDDVFLVTFMKCGTTWMQECAWLLLNNLNYKTANSEIITSRSPFLDFCMSPRSNNHLELCGRLQSPRLLKTHLPANLLPFQVWQNKQKIIYVARNVKDVIVSLYHFLKDLTMWCGNKFEDFVDDFINDEILYTHFWSHIVDFWKMRNESFIFFVTYEEMKRDLAGVVRKLCTFLQKPQLSDVEMAKLVDHLSFENMKKNPQTNLTYLLKANSQNVSPNFEFMRRGIVGSFKDEMSPELQAKIDKWSAEFLGQHGLTEEDIFVGSNLCKFQRPTLRSETDRMLKSIEHSTEASKARLPFAVKRYATEGKHIPLEKNWSETWCTLTARFETVSNEFLNFDVRHDDVFVVSYMKSGTTWMQECAWLLLNKLDYEKSKELPVMIRSPYLEFHSLAPYIDNHVELLKNLHSPRLIKSHLPANLLPTQVWEKKQKIIYVARNAKDVIVSSYHFVKNLGMWKGDNIEDYVEDFLNSEILYTHFWAHVVDYWKMRNELFIFFVTYEEMKRDLAGVLKRLCDFLGRPQLTNEELPQLLKYLSFDNMKKNKNTNLTYMLRDCSPVVKEQFQFMRRGIVGSFKDELTPELQAKIDKWTSDYLMQHGLTEEDIFGRYM